MTYRVVFRTVVLLVSCLNAVAASALTYEEFRSPDQAHRPEVWFNIIGGNASKAGITADLEAIAAAGCSGIQLFHGDFGVLWPNVDEQIRCLSPKWDDLIRHVSEECERLGLTFKLQNCPGWSMSGGPWIGLDKCMRQLVVSRTDVCGGEKDVRLALPCVGTHTPTGWAPERQIYEGCADYRDVAVLAFPTPEGDGADARLRPKVSRVQGQVHEFEYDAPVVVRSVEIPSASVINHAWCYELDLRVVVEADGTVVADALMPRGNWQDFTPQTIACDEFAARKIRVSFHSPHVLDIPFVRLSSAARLDNWESLAGWTLRDVVHRRCPRQRAGAWIDPATIVDVSDNLKKDGTLDWTAPKGKWTILRFGHANQGRRNHPAPAAATGWECDKLDPCGADAAFDGYVGRIAKDVLSAGSLRGFLIDSWECMRQTWTWRMPEYYRNQVGGDIRRILPQIFGWIVGTPAETERDLLAWRGLLGRLAEENYFGRMAWKAHKAGLTIQYETAFGDVLPGDLMRFWKFADEPMCEFWSPHRNRGFVGSYNFKPVRPCVSASHLYGKNRVVAEAFTSFELTWDEDHRLLKNVANKHLSRGVTHCALQAYTHNPVLGQRPSSSFGDAIGTPFLREQTWWPWMRDFTDYLSRCEVMLESGMPVVDVLRVLGDELGHRPDENFELRGGFKYDLLNTDVLMSTLSVQDGCFCVPGGARYAVVWVPEDVWLKPQTEARLKELSRQGGRIVRGGDPTVGLVPDVKGTADLMWYHRKDGDVDLYFVAAGSRGWKGDLEFPRMAGRAAELWDPVVGSRRCGASGNLVRLNLFPEESCFVVFGVGGATPVASPERQIADLSGGWTLAIGNEGVQLQCLMPWKDLPLGDRERAHSGTATYRRSFVLQDKPFGRIVLDLGRVERWAKVEVNGRKVASLWCEPYRADVTDAIKRGWNDVEITIASTWFNQLVYDAGRPEPERKTWTIAGPSARSPMRDYGMMGPVILLAE